MLVLIYRVHERFSVLRADDLTALGDFVVKFISVTCSRVASATRSASTLAIRCYNINSLPCVRDLPFGIRLGYYISYHAISLEDHESCLHERGHLNDG